MKKQIRIVFAPLDWGLGHATRMIPLIDAFSEKDCEVIIAGNGKSLKFLKQYYQDKEIINIGGPDIKYGKSRALNLFFFIRLPFYLLNSFRDKFRIKRLVNKLKPDVVISDNRPFFVSKSVYCIYVTHQINIFLPGGLRIFNSLLSKINRHRINKYKQCWVPDFSSKLSLSGKLSDTKTNNCRKIGVLSRFIANKKDAPSSKDFDFTVILSGPEPQRSIFEKTIITKFTNTSYKVAVIRGKPSETDFFEDEPNMFFFNHLGDAEFIDLINRSNNIICRSGYSTIMDLVVLGRKAILVPTPGQPEQEYLADNLFENFGFVRYDQKIFSEKEISQLIHTGGNVMDFKIDCDFNQNLQNLISETINKINCL